LPDRERHDGQCRVLGAAGRELAAVRGEQIGDIVGLAVLVANAVLRLLEATPVSPKPGKVSISYPPAKPRDGSCRDSSLMIPAIWVPRSKFTRPGMMA
jgi:hypothetical protein